MSGSEALDVAKANGYKPILDLAEPFSINLMEGIAPCATLRLVPPSANDENKRRQAAAKEELKPSDFSETTVESFTLFPCYFKAQAVNFGDFVRDFSEHYHALNVINLETLDFLGTPVERGELLLEDGEWVIGAATEQGKYWHLSITEATEDQRASVVNTKPKF